MPTKKQLGQMREAESEYPGIRRDDDPLKTTIMSNPKKKTPLQELLQFIKNDLGYYYDPEDAIGKIETKAESMLPKEKEFAKEMWDEGASNAEYSARGNEECIELFSEYYKQFEL